MTTDFIVPEPKHSVSAPIEERRPPGIIVGVKAVLAAIDLDDEHQLAAEKIDDERINRMLSNELETLDASVANKAPN